MHWHGNYLILNKLMKCILRQEMEDLQIDEERVDCEHHLLVRRPPRDAVQVDRPLERGGGVRVALRRGEREEALGLERVPRDAVAGLGGARRARRLSRRRARVCFFPRSCSGGVCFLRRRRRRARGS